MTDVWTAAQEEPRYPFDCNIIALSVEKNDCMKMFIFFSAPPDISLKILKSRAHPHSPRLLVAQLECLTNDTVATPMSSDTAETSWKQFGSHTQKGITANCWQHVCGNFTVLHVLLYCVASLGSCRVTNTLELSVCFQLEYTFASLTIIPRRIFYDFGSEEHGDNFHVCQK